MINVEEEIISDQTVSCTIDEAVMQLLGISAIRPEITEESEPFYDVILDDILWNEICRAEAEYNNAKVDKLSKDVIAEKFLGLKKADLLNTNARRYRSDIIDELAKDGNSDLRIDKLATTNPAYPYITVKSLNLWAQKIYSISIYNFANAQAVIVSIPKTHEQTAHDSKPWMIVDGRDPKAAQPWYTPARYFARQLVKNDSTLLAKRDSLVNKINQSLSAAGIYKRGGQKPPSPDTIKKALANVKLG